MLAQLRQGRASDPLQDAWVVVAHPDDEIVGCASRLAMLRDATFVYVTDGAPQDGADAATHGLSVDAYRQRRREERDRALAMCGIAPSQVVELGCPDQQAALKLVPLTRALLARARRQPPQVILTHPYEGGHPDHDAAAFIVHAARALLRHERADVPDVIEMASYHNGPDGIVACEFLPEPGADAQQVTIELTPEESQRKRALLDCHETQRRTLAGFPLHFERFRPAPAYDFTRPPHEGTLLYELRGWAIDGARFRAQAAAALDELGLHSPL